MWLKVNKINKLSILLPVVICYLFFINQVFSFFVGICLPGSKMQDLKNKMMWAGSCLEKYPSEKTHRKILKKYKRYLL